MLVNINNEIVAVEDFDGLRQIIKEWNKSGKIMALPLNANLVMLDDYATSNSPLPLSATDFNFVRLTMDDYI